MSQQSTDLTRGRVQSVFPGHCPCDRAHLQAGTSVMSPTRSLVVSPESTARRRLHDRDRHPALLRPRPHTRRGETL
jgi:hypothetical protein